MGGRPRQRGGNKPQGDIILYEQDICPVFSINGSGDDVLPVRMCELNGYPRTGLIGKDWTSSGRTVTLEHVPIKALGGQISTPTRPRP